MDDLFTLADKLRELREEKDAQNQLLKELNAGIDKAEYKLTEAMAAAECPSFIRGNKQFIMTTTTRWSAEAERKEDLYATLRANGYGHLFTVNPQTLGSFVREQVEETADANGVTHVPGWLSGLVKSFDDVGITMKGATKKTK